MSKKIRMRKRSLPLISRNLPTLLKFILAEIDRGLEPELDIELDRELARAHVNDAAFSGLAQAKIRAANYGLELKHLDLMEDMLANENNHIYDKLQALIAKINKPPKK